MASDGSGGGADGSSGDSSVAGEPAVELDGVTKRYATTTAVDDVSLFVRRGEFFTLVGPSGCGKTTTLRLIAGFETPDAGAFRFGGEDVTGVPPEDRDVGIVFQNYALFPHMTVAENVAYGLNFADPPGGVSADERVAELLELVDLGGTEERDPTELSGGQQQRVSLARALAPGPDLLLLDEPMSALDARLRERLRRDVRSIQRDLGVTTVYVTHDQAEALAVSDRVAVMNDGRVEQVGEPRALYRRPESRFVAEFLGENNVFDGHVVDSDGGEGVSQGPEFPSGDMSQPADETGESTEQRAEDETARGTVRIQGVDVEVPVVDADAGDRVTFCVRPSAFRVESGVNRLTGRIAASEFLGERTSVYLEWEGRRLVVALEASPDDEGEELTVGFDPGAAWILPERPRRRPPTPARLCSRAASNVIRRGDDMRVWTWTTSTGSRSRRRSTSDG